MNKFSSLKFNKTKAPVNSSVASYNPFDYPWMATINILWSFYAPFLVSSEFSLPRWPQNDHWPWCTRKSKLSCLNKNATAAARRSLVSTVIMVVRKDHSDWWAECMEHIVDRIWSTFNGLFGGFDGQQKGVVNDDDKHLFSPSSQALPVCGRRTLWGPGFVLNFKDHKSRRIAQQVRLLQTRDFISCGCVDTTGSLLNW